MGYQIIKQPESGKYAIWSTIADGFVLLDAGESEVCDWFVEQAARTALQSTREILAKIKAGKPAYYQFTMTWRDALDRLAEKRRR